MYKLFRIIVAIFVIAGLNAGNACACIRTNKRENVISYSVLRINKLELSEVHENFEESLFECENETEDDNGKSFAESINLRQLYNHPDIFLLPSVYNGDKFNHVALNILYCNYRI